MYIIQIIIFVICIILCVIFRKSEYVAVIPFAGFLSAIVITYIKHRRQEKEIEELTKYLLRVQDKLELPALKDNYEGNLGILQSEIYKVVAILKQSYSNEVSEKRYLVDMLSDISHQIKTPLTAITMMTELLETPELSDEKRLEYIEKIDSQVSKITWLVKNILTLSQLEANVIELKAEEVNVKSMLDKIGETFEIMAEVKEVKLSINAPEQCTLICDRHWTGEAISNIVKNCIEHTESGGQVSINVTKDNISTVIRIKDDGEGIKEEHLPHIFERFYKSSSDKNSVGIGLAMAKEIIQKQEGKITVTSEVGVGTEFVIKIYR